MNTRARNDHWIYRAVVVLGFTVLTSLGGSLLLALTNHQPADMIVALGSAAIGGLAGLLAPAPTSK